MRMFVVRTRISDRARRKVDSRRRGRMLGESGGAVTGAAADVQNGRLVTQMCCEVGSEAVARQMLGP